MVLLFLKKAYTKLIDDYFHDASFIKPTGDGLLIIYVQKENHLKETANKAVASSLGVVRDFDTFVSSEPLLADKAPRKVGIGIAIGSACRLVSEGRVLDYSGRPVNLASRLTSMARPSGIVFDAKMHSLLTDDLKKQFSKETVYAYGIGEKSGEGISVYSFRNCTVIPGMYRQPLDMPDYFTSKAKQSVKQIKSIAKNPGFFTFVLGKRVLDPREIKVSVVIPPKKAKKSGVTHITASRTVISHFVRSGQDCVECSFKGLVGHLVEFGMKNEDMVTFEIRYPLKPSTVVQPNHSQVV